MNRRFVVVLAAIMIMVPLVGAMFGFGALKSRSSYNLPDLATTTSFSLGLTFSLILNSTRLQRGQAVNITAYATNIRLTPNTLTIADDWAESWLGPGWASIDSCGSFADVSLVQGYYTWSNISLIQSPADLQLAKPMPPYSCPFIPGPWSSFYPFQPRGSRVGYYFSASGYYISFEPSEGRFILFNPGVYTAVAGDEWGQIVLLHFIVGSS